jgi:hypothetical protein
MTSPSDHDEIAKQAREHAWNWFALHATTRTARRRTVYEPTREAAMAAFAKSWRRE